ncbi:MAG: flagellar basal body rod protein FlgC [Gammaproteobacteria bacterium]|nr:flagellar basal body rod protein FlgC [Gammaproteobacteria bacterium]
MALLDVFNIAGSAMSAQSVRMNVTASNLANVDSSSGSAEEVYRARQPVFQSMMGNFMSDMESVGVKVSEIVESQAALSQKYQPEHPQADEQGYVYMTNVDPIQEMANMISASRAYQNNVEIVNTSKEMLLRTLSLGQ